MTVPPIDISPENWQIVQDILQKHVPDHEVWAFGSRAKRTAQTYSDLDLVIVTDKPLSLRVSADMSDDFSESDLPFASTCWTGTRRKRAFVGSLKRTKSCCGPEQRVSGNETNPLADVMFRSAVERQFEIVGEALARFARDAPHLAARIPDLRSAIACETR